ncbi:MAG: hypothetical protein ACREU8_01795, partial [Gammaproteobacteria bacterium]
MQDENKSVTFSHERRAIDQARVGCAEERSASFELFTRANVEYSLATPVYRINATGRIGVKA